MHYKRLSFKHKNNRVKYYLLNYLKQTIPNKFFQKQLPNKLKHNFNLTQINQRVNYYNKISKNFKLNQNAKLLKNIRLKDGHKTYYFDFYQHSKFFNQQLKCNVIFGDNTIIPKFPTFVKSRPISAQNHNCVILKLNKIRHFTFVNKNKYKFSDKKNKLVFRGKVHEPQLNRINFFKQHIHNQMCNIGKVNHNNLPNNWIKQRLTINEQLKYKFILCLEGNDVASNLKWVMSSNSIAVMPKPKFETWFMEGKLIANVHYILINDDYRDLNNKLKYYIENTTKAKEIIKNANAHVAQFKLTAKENLISLLVMKKYFNILN